MKIKREMIIGDVIEKYPVAAEVMAKCGLTCIGCHASPYESIEAGAKAHGMSEKNINEMIKHINKAIENYKEPQSKDLPPFHMSKLAIEKIKMIMESKDKKDYGLRVGIKAGGCAGYAYFMDFEKNPDKGDEVIRFNGLKVFIDKESYGRLAGVELDYIETINESGFKFNNPHAQNNCGCGKSFR